MAIERMDRALSEFAIEGRGVKTTIPFHRRVFDNEQFRSGDVTDGLHRALHDRAAGRRGSELAKEARMAEVPQHVLDYIAGASALTLATASGDGAPHAATHLYVNDGIDLFIWLKPSSRTAQNLKANPRVGFAIDEYAEDLRQTKGVQGSGGCEPVTGEGIAEAAMKFGEKFPDLSPGGSTANISFHRIRPDQLEFIDNSGTQQDAEEFGFSYSSDQVYGG